MHNQPEPQPPTRRQLQLQPQQQSRTCQWVDACLFVQDLCLTLNLGLVVPIARLHHVYAGLQALNSHGGLNLCASPRQQKPQNPMNIASLHVQLDEESMWGGCWIAVSIAGLPC